MNHIRVNLILFISALVKGTNVFKATEWLSKSHRLIKSLLLYFTGKERVYLLYWDTSKLKEIDGFLFLVHN